MSDQLDVGYIAGIIDARGHVSLEGGRRGVLLPRVRVTTRRLDLLHWLAGRTGVAIRLDERGYSRRACGEHCADKHSHVERQSAYWNVDGARAVVVLWNVYPWLVCQRAKVTEALSTARLYWPTTLDGRTEVTVAMAGHGWRIPQRADLPTGIVATVPL